MASAVWSPTRSSLITPSKSPSRFSPVSSTDCIPISWLEASRLKSRTKATDPFHWKPRTTRSRAMPCRPRMSAVTPARQSAGSMNGMASVPMQLFGGMGSGPGAVRVMITVP